MKSSNSYCTVDIIRVTKRSKQKLAVSNFNSGFNYVAPTSAATPFHIFVMTLPIPFAPTTIPTAKIAARSPYSIAVAPLSFLINRANIFLTFRMSSHHSHRRPRVSLSLISTANGISAGTRSRSQIRSGNTQRTCCPSFGRTIPSH